jgi:hypothetical protein
LKIPRRLRRGGLLIHYVECGTAFIEEFGDIPEQYYTSLESVFENALKAMKQFNEIAMENFIQRLRVIIAKADDLGCGYGDTLSDSFHEAYE